MLTAQEQAELAQLEQEEAQVSRPQSGLTPQEAEELKMLEAEEAGAQGGGIGQGMLDAATWVGQKYDQYGGSGAARAGLQALGEGKGVMGAAGAAWDQYGKPSAPSGKDVATTFGMSTANPVIRTSQDQQKFDEMFNPGMAASRKQANIQAPETRGASPAGAMGTVIDLVVDPFAALPIGKAAGLGADGLGYLGKGTGRLALSGSAKAAEFALGAERMADIGSTLKTGRSAVTNSFESAMKKFNPTVAKDAPDIAKVLEKHSVIKAGDEIPEALQFGADSTPANMARYVMEGPGGDAKKEAFKGFVQKLDNAVFDNVAKISKGAPTDAVSAGNLLIDGYNKGIDQFFGSMDVTYKEVAKNLPSLKLNDAAITKMNDTLVGLEKEAAKMVQRGYGGAPAEGKEILRAIRSIRKDWGSPTQMASMIEELQALGQAAFKKSPPVLGAPPASAKHFKKLYATVRDGVHDTLAGHDPVLGSMLKENNEKFTKMFEDQRGLAGFIGKDPAPEIAFKRLISNGDTNTIDALKSMLGPDDMEVLKGAYLEGLIKKNKAGLVDYDGTINNIRSPKNVPALKALFGNDPRIEEVAEILGVGKRLGQRILNPSGTNTAGRIGRMVDDIAGSAVDETMLETMKNRAVRNSEPKQYAPSGLSKVMSQINANKGAGLKGSQTIYALERPKGLRAAIGQDEKEQYRRPGARK